MNKLNLDSIMTDEFGKTGTIIDKVAKVEEEHEEMLNEYMNGDEEKLFSETLDAIQALRSFLVYQYESVGVETVARYLADWTAKQENRKRKYLKNDKDSLCNICKYKNCWYGCESNSFQAKKITLCGKFAKKEEKAMECEIISFRNYIEDYTKRVEELFQETEKFKKYIDEFNKKNIFVEVEFQFKLKGKQEGNNGN